jgi:hypothetical protein
VTSPKAKATAIIPTKRSAIRAPSFELISERMELIMNCVFPTNGADAVNFVPL